MPHTDDHDEFDEAHEHLDERGKEFSRGVGEERTAETVRREGVTPEDLDEDEHTGKEWARGVADEPTDYRGEPHHD